METSVLPPRLVAQLEAMPEAERLARLLVLIARYKQRADSLDPAKWAYNQRLHLLGCAYELEDMLPRRNQ